MLTDEEKKTLADCLCDIACCCDEHGSGNCKTFNTIEQILKSRLAAQRTEILAKVEALKNPYPETVFIEPTEKQWADMHECLMKNLNIPIDKIGGSVGRMVWNTCKSKIKEQIIESVR